MNWLELTAIVSAIGDDDLLESVFSKFCIRK